MQSNNNKIIIDHQNSILNYKQGRIYNRHVSYLESTSKPSRWIKATTGL